MAEKTIDQLCEELMARKERARYPVGKDAVEKQQDVYKRQALKLWEEVLGGNVRMYKRYRIVTVSYTHLFRHQMHRQRRS